MVGRMMIKRSDLLYTQGDSLKSFKRETDGQICFKKIAWRKNAFNRGVRGVRSSEEECVPTGS